MWFKRRDSKGKQRVVAGFFSESLRKRSLDDPSPSSSSSRPPSSYLHPPAPSIDAHHADVPHHGHTLKNQRSQFLRLFGRRVVTPRSSSESLSSVSTSFSASTGSTTNGRKVRPAPSHSSLSSSASSCAAPRTSTSSASSGRKESKESLGKEKGTRLARDRGRRETTKPPPKAPYTPDLPPELWVYILHLASDPFHPFLGSSYSQSSPTSSTPPPSPSTSTSGGEPVSFLTYPSASSSAHLAHAYERMMGFKLSLTTVCKLWHAIGQEVLWDFVWIRSGKHAEMVLRTLDAKALRTPSIEGKSVETYAYDTRNLGRHIRRLHIEPSSNPALDFDRCNPETVLRILRHATGLQVFSDFRGIRRRSKFGVWGPSPIVTSSSSSSAVVMVDLEEEETSRDEEPTTRVPPYTYTATSTTSITASISTSSSSESSNPSFFDGFNTPSSATSSPASSACASPPPLSACSSISSTSFDESDDPLLAALLSPASGSTSLKRLSWTSYDHPVPSPSSSLLALDDADLQDPEDIHNEERQREREYAEGVRYFARVVGPKIEMAAERLEFLELTLCAAELGSGGGGGGWLDAMIPGGLGKSRVGGGGGGMGLGGVEEMVGRALELPVLRSLKVTLDNATFHVLSTWSIPALVNLSVISADFSYAGDGFREFFEAHGAKLRQLELGHSTEAIEDHFLSASPQHPFGHPSLGPHHANADASSSANDEGTGWRYGGMRVPLADWCPDLEQFICSAEAEWNWQNPDWIAPHILLPAHPTLELIGVRDLEKRIREGLDRCANFDRVQLGRQIDAERKGKGRLDGAEGALKSGIGGIAGVEVRTRDGQEIRVDGDEAFFMLTEQFGSLFNRGAFPALKYVRDLSWESAAMRSEGVEEVMGGRVGVARNVNGVRGGEVNGRHPMGAVRGFLRDMLRPSQPACLASSSSSSRHPSTPVSLVSDREAELQRRLGIQQHRRVLRFWMRVLEKCKERGVYLEDWAGWNVTVGEMRRVAMVEAGDEAER